LQDLIKREPIHEDSVFLQTFESETRDADVKHERIESVKQRFGGTRSFNKLPKESGKKHGQNRGTDLPRYIKKKTEKKNFFLKKKNLESFDVSCSVCWTRGTRYIRQNTRIHEQWPSFSEISDAKNCKTSKTQITCKKEVCALVILI
jgi:hypothetical protein